MALPSGKSGLAEIAERAAAVMHLMRPGFLVKDSRLFPDDPSFANKSYRPKF
jgi:hypothetical protein